MEYILGIDLGTTNSCVFYKDEGGSFKNIPVENSNTIPSVVAFKDDKILVGKQAENQKLILPKDTVYAFKRLIGRRWESQFLQNAIAHYSYIITKKEDSTIRIIVQNQEYTIEEISAMVLLKIKQEASKLLRKDIKKTVITVTAYFNDNQRKSTKDAGIIAGLDVLRIINEPTAAALAYGFRQQKNQFVLVYDLGGGTFDVTLLEINEDVFEVIATAGDTFLGGEDFTNRIVEWIERDIIERYERKFELSKDAIVHQRVKDAAEKTKKELSSRNLVNIDLPFLFTDSNKNTINYSSALTRDELNDLTASLVEKSIDILSGVMDHLGFSKDDIDQVLLVGGQTRMPLIQESLEGFFGKNVSKGINPDEAVAMGAAIQGTLLTDDQHTSVLLDIIAQSMGIMVSGGFYEKIIEKGSVIPCSAEKVFTTIRNNQTIVEINIFQGEAWSAEDNTFLGSIKIKDIPPLPQGEFKVNVRFIINSEGILRVEATNLHTGEIHDLTIEGSSGITSDELKKLKDKCALSYEKSEQRAYLMSYVELVKKLIPEVIPVLQRNGKPLNKIEQYKIFIESIERMRDISTDKYEEYLGTLKAIASALDTLIKS